MTDNVVRSGAPAAHPEAVFLLLQAPEGPRAASLTASALRDRRGNRGPTSTVDLVSASRPRRASSRAVCSTAEGDPVTGVQVVYLNTPDGPRPVSPFRHAPERRAKPWWASPACPVGAAGTFTVRYVRQHSPRCPFHLVTRDPVSGAQRYVSAHIRGDGDRLVRDIVFFGARKVRASSEPATGRSWPARP